MTDSQDAVYGAGPALAEARKALRCLRLEVSTAVADDVERRMEAAFSALKEESTDARIIAAMRAAHTPPAAEPGTLDEELATIRREWEEDQTSLSDNRIDTLFRAAMRRAEPGYGELLAENKILCDDLRRLRGEVERAKADHAAEPNRQNPDDYVAWCRFTNKTIATCDSDAPGAFKVYRLSAMNDKWAWLEFVASDRGVLAGRVTELQDRLTAAESARQAAEAERDDLSATLARVRKELRAASESAAEDDPERVKVSICRDCGTLYEHNTISQRLCEACYATRQRNRA